MNLKQAGILGFYAGAVVGGGVAYLVTKRRLRAGYERLAKEEVAQAKEFYERKYKTKSPAALVEELHPEDFESGDVKEAVQQLGYSVTKSESSEQDKTSAIQSIHGTVRKDTKLEEDEHGSDTRASVSEESFNVFRQRDKDLEWDQDHEDAWRKQQPNMPYVIHEDEYNEITPHEKVSLTYWDEDDVLAESHGTGTEAHIPDPDSIVGIENLDKFGYGSSDPNIVHVRNDRLGMDYEIVLQQGSYARTVLGFDDNLEHADRPKNRQLRRFRE